MTIKLDDELARKLEDAAAKRAVSVDDFASAILEDYLGSRDADPEAWVRATQSRLGNVWPAEDFSGWR
jgi:predicted transcriptional regulator